jgi:hypothetical protein
MYLKKTVHSPRASLSPPVTSCDFPMR